MVTRTTLPLAVLEALEAFTKTCQMYGYEARAYNRDPRLEELKEAVQVAHREMVVARAALVDAIESHAAVLYEGGLELGRAEALQ